MAHKDGKWYISNQYGSPFAYEINPDTICQYTGLTDKNGNRIWENDIIQINYITDVFAQIKFGRYCSSFDSGVNNQGFYADMPDETYFRKDLGYWNSKVTVAGNVFDNLELLQEESK